MRTDIIEGATLPDYELPDHTNTRRTLSLLQGNDPMILMLGRGFYCPKDRQQLHELVRFSKQCAVGFTRLVTSTTDTFVQLNDLRNVSSSLRQLGSEFKEDRPALIGRASLLLNSIDGKLLHPWLLNRRRVDPNGRRQRWRLGRSAHKTLRMSLVRCR